MVKTEQKTSRWQTYKPLLATALVVAGAFNLVSAAIAEGTAAGTPITNTATATYNDGDPANVINATSNTVTIIVAEVAGITAVPNGFLDANGGAIEGTDLLTYSFLVTNTGNDATDVFIPGTDNISALNFNVKGADGKVEIFSVNDLNTPLGVVPAAGGNYSTIVGGNATVLPDGQFVVKVTGRVANGTIAGQPVSVTLGDVPDNDNTPATQNQPLSLGTNPLANLYTVDAGIITPGYAPREASASQSRPFASADNPLALATVLKNSSVVGNSSTSATDDQITYDLGLRVESVVPPGSAFQAGSLAGTPIQLDGTSQTRVLISDAIPANTVLQSVSTPPSGWTAVYSTVAASGSDPLATTPTWSTTAPAILSDVTRIGFVNNGPLAPGFSVAGLKFTVVTSGLTSPGGVVNNLAQVFGSTVGGPVNNIVYDESGDQNPNNFENNQPGAPYSPGNDDGVVAPNPAPGNIDPGGNTGTGPGGEVNQVTISLTTSSILNGPNATPAAVGPNNDNDDFTNKSTIVPPGTGPAGPGNIPPTGVFNPGLVTFDNTLTNPATAGFLSNVTLQPIAPSLAASTTTSPIDRYGSNSFAITSTGSTKTPIDIPDGTVVTIDYSGNTAVYRYTGGTFVFEPGTTAHINVGSVTPNQQVNYTVAVQLPNGQPALQSVAIPIIAFPDDDPVASPGFGNEVTYNITIDRIYTGFVSLFKQARVFSADNTTTPRIDFTDTFTAAQNILPGEFIEYKVDYVNISEASAGSGNVTLSANNFVVAEDGTTGGNNWAANTTHQQNTQFKPGTTVLYTGATSATTFSTDPVSGTRVDIYQNTVGTVLPGPANGGSLIFRRRIN